MSTLTISRARAAAGARGGAGRFDEAVTLLRRAWDRERHRNFAAHHSPLSTRRGDIDATLVWLRRAVELRYPRRQMLDTDPDLEAVRRDPRFAQLRVD